MRTGVSKDVKVSENVRSDPECTEVMERFPLPLLVGIE